MSVTVLRWGLPPREEDSVSVYGTRITEGVIVFSNSSDYEYLKDVALVKGRGYFRTRNVSSCLLVKGEKVESDFFTEEYVTRDDVSFYGLVIAEDSDKQVAVSIKNKDLFTDYDGNRYLGKEVFVSRTRVCSECKARFQPNGHGKCPSCDLERVLRCASTSSCGCDDDYDCDCNYDGSSLAEYHSLYRLNEGKNYRFKVGFEVEKEDYDVKNQSSYVDIYRSTRWCKEDDGSLNDSSGFELVSPILPLRASLKEVNAAIDSVADCVNAKYSNSCGGHIHVSDMQRTPHQIIVDTAGYFALLYAMYPSRVRNPYSSARDKKSYERVGGRSAISQGWRTVEFRIFPSPKSVETLKFRAKLLRLMLTIPRQETAQVQRDLLNSKSKLVRLLKTVYSREKFLELYQRFISFAKSIDNETLEAKMPTSTVKKPKASAQASMFEQAV